MLVWHQKMLPCINGMHKKCSSNEVTFNSGRCERTISLSAAKDWLYYKLCKSLVIIVPSHDTGLEVVNDSTILLIIKGYHQYNAVSKIRFLALMEGTGPSE